MKTTSIASILEEKRVNWPMGACSLMIEIEDFSGTCGRCGWSFEDHEYIQHAEVAEDEEGNTIWILKDI